ncbi:Synaptosomal-associated protein 23 [Nowakowskiella sp. JEL0407]|nr:Synaptosomal-associated protein 23 [Nowakowskiella sp. JEL0407]
MPEIDNSLRLNVADGEDDLDALVSETINTQQESVDVSGRALKKALEVEQLGISNASKLHQQGEQFNNMEHKLDSVETHISNSKSKMGVLDKLANRPFWMPVFGQNVADKSLPVQPNGKPIPTNPDGVPLWKPRNASLPPGTVLNNGLLDTSQSKVGDWATEEQRMQSAKMEQQINSNLTQLSGVLGNVKDIALGMNQTIKDHNAQLGVITDRVETGSANVERMNAKLKKQHGV